MHAEGASALRQAMSKRRREEEEKAMEEEDAEDALWLSERKRKRRRIQAVGAICVALLAILVLLNQCVSLPRQVPVGASIAERRTRERKTWTTSFSSLGRSTCGTWRETRWKSFASPRPRLSISRASSSGPTARSQRLLETGKAHALRPSIAEAWHLTRTQVYASVCNVLRAPASHDRGHARRQCHHPADQ
jgi:hypothetical protein